MDLLCPALSTVLVHKVYNTREPGHMKCPGFLFLKYYFRWRAEDANRNALNAWCYWKLREKYLSVAEATKQLGGKSISEKNELLFQFGINYNDLPAWQKRGIGFLYEETERISLNPVKKEQGSCYQKEP